MSVGLADSSHGDLSHENGVAVLKVQLSILYAHGSASSFTDIFYIQHCGLLKLR